MLGTVGMLTMLGVAGAGRFGLLTALCLAGQAAAGVGDLRDRLAPRHREPEARINANAAAELARRRLRSAR